MTLYERHRVPFRLLFGSMFRIRAVGVEHMPRSGGVVVVCNHLTMIDPLQLGA
jgi:1-acyl-sn-glycerol-3-phosphate acyltransferase